MRIRSITYFLDPGWPLVVSRLDEAGRLLENARAALVKSGYEVQTLRLATVPFPQLLPGALSAVDDLVRRLDAECARCGIDYFSIGPALPDVPDSYPVVSAALAASERVFASGIVAEPDRGLSLRSARRAAQTIVDVSRVETNGFGNLRFAALACVPPGSPFFPAAYHGGGAPRFAMATEAADLAVEAMSEVKSITDGRARLTQAIERNAAVLSRAGQNLAGEAEFAGIDFSLAPFPQEARSLGTAFERMGVPRAGLAGSVLTAVLLTGAIDAAVFPRTGFCGLLLPPFEDSTLAARAADGSLTISDLLLYSTVCGTGLDTIPLAGDVSPDRIAPLLMDVAALALRHRKALTARLMPLPGKKAGDEAEFAFDYFAPTRVMELPSLGSRGMLADETSDWVPITPRVL